MRLSENERTSIRNVVLGLDPKAQVYLFGSRVDDQKRGGDIDLLILSSIITQQHQRSIKLKLYDALGEQKIDLLIASDTTPPFVQIALEKALPL